MNVVKLRLVEKKEKGFLGRWKDIDKGIIVWSLKIPEAQNHWIYFLLV